ncbi:gag/pol protein [Cucumis melo var. makuwa]|uniref:Gag/pol protein n=1 Tax=Cucumis melo var. makuwa TaxID=1194695 RepID=A0A5A7SUJ1_CUCMM|nr:gag/pol protein [Cucumis melo var. makuwa]
MILVIADLRFVLMEECPPFPSQNASQSVKDVYNRWTKANGKACLYILASMSDILSKKHEIMEVFTFIFWIIENLEEERREGERFTIAVEGKRKTKETSFFKQLEKSEMTLKVGTGDVISACGVGDAKLGHINLDWIGRLVKNELLNELEDDSLPPCESCLEGKMTKRSFTRKGYKAKEPLELIHSDLSDPMNVKARGDFEYFIYFIDDYSRYDHLYLMEHKSEALEKFKEYKAEVENLLTHVLVTNPKKLEPRSRLCQFVGYPKKTRGGLFFDPQENRVFVSTNATFLEEDHMRDHKPRSKLVLNEAIDGSTRVVDEVGRSSRVDETTTSNQSHPSQLFIKRHGVHLSKEQCFKTPQEVEDMRCIPYASTVARHLLCSGNSQ